MKLKILQNLFILPLALLASACWSGSLFPNAYDADFNKSASRWLPGVDQRLLKAQCYQESLLKPLAVSPVGAQGLCQFMPGTWSDVVVQLSLPPESSAFAPELSIEAAAYYMAKLRNGWSSPRPETDRHSLAMASYNAGFGHLLKAQKVCGGGVLYADIIACLPSVTGHHSKETIGYVEKTWSWYLKMVFGG